MLLLYDGQCLMCNRLIQHLLKMDRKDELRVAALQHYMETDKALVVPVREDIDTVILVDQDKVYYKSAAVLHAGRKLSRWSFVYQIALLFPRFLRDAVYDLIAKRRYQWFGRASQCLLPEVSLRHKYLTNANELASFFSRTV